MGRRPIDWTTGGGTSVFLIIAFPLWVEMREPGNAGWNVILALMLLALVICAIVLQRYFKAQDIGEARFDTRNGREP